MKQGIFYAVGVGAGDPMDMTLRAKAVLEQADIIVTPIPKAGGTSAAYAIAAQAADLSHAERLDILFPMQAHNDYRERLRSGVLQPVCAALDSGRQVAMVTLGDVSVYSTASYVRQLLAEKGYATQVIAGVPSFCAGAAKAQQSLCENSESLQILPAVHSREAVPARRFFPYQPLPRTPITLSLCAAYASGRTCSVRSFQSGPDCSACSSW